MGHGPFWNLGQSAAGGPFSFFLFFYLFFSVFFCEFCKKDPKKIQINFEFCKSISSVV
jgi:hypothetical protein